MRKDTKEEYRRDLVYKTGCKPEEILFDSVELAAKKGITTRQFQRGHWQQTDSVTVNSGQYLSGYDTKTGSLYLEPKRGPNGRFPCHIKPWTTVTTATHNVDQHRERVSKQRATAGRKGGKAPRKKIVGGTTQYE